MSPPSRCTFCYSAVHQHTAEELFLPIQEFSLGLGKMRSRVKWFFHNSQNNHTATKDHKEVVSTA